MPSAILCLVGYLFGSISSAIILSRAMGLPDPRTEGSGNPGATNMMRTGGKKAAALTLVGDLLKGLVPVLIAKGLGASLDTQLLVALAALLGHLFPVFFNFKGGKGVATALGVLIALDWRVGVACIATWLAIYALKKISSLAALTAIAVTPAYIWVLTHSMTFVIFGIALAALVFWRHKTNIAQLLAGTGG